MLGIVTFASTVTFIIQLQWSKVLQLKNSTYICTQLIHKVMEWFPWLLLTTVGWLVDQHGMHGNDILTNYGADIRNNGGWVKILQQHFVIMKMLYLSNSFLVGLKLTLCYGNVLHNGQASYLDVMATDTLEAIPVCLYIRGWY